MGSFTKSSTICTALLSFNSTKRCSSLTAVYEKQMLPYISQFSSIKHLLWCLVFKAYQLFVVNLFGFKEPNIIKTVWCYTSRYSYLRHTLLIPWWYGYRCICLSYFSWLDLHCLASALVWGGRFDRGTPVKANKTQQTQVWVGSGLTTKIFMAQFSSQCPIRRSSMLILDMRAYVL